MKLNLLSFSSSEAKHPVMSRKLTMAICFLLLAFSGFTQSPDSSLDLDNRQKQVKQLSASQKAANQINNLQEKLALNKQQVQDIYMILLKKDVQLDSLKNYPPESRKDERLMRRNINQDADKQIEALLSLDQVQQFEQLKAAQREKAQERKNQNANSPQQ